MLVRDVLELYLRHSEATGLHSPDALADRRYTFSLFAAALGGLAVEECRAFHLTDFIEGHAAWKSAATRRIKAGQVRAAFAWAVNEERIGRNPFVRVKYPESERRPDMPDKVLSQICDLGSKPFERALRFLRLTGCRLSELCAATWADVDLDRGVWVVPKHKSRRHTRKPKLLALVPEAVALVRAVAAAQAKQGATFGVAAAAPLAPIFTNSRGTAWNRRTLGQQLRRLKRRHGITEPATLHGIRHRFGSAAIAAGAALKLVSVQLGHASSAVTERFYCDLSGEIEALRAAAQLGQPRPDAEKR